MRRFHSYGPVDAEQHFCVPRRTLVDTCINQLIGNPDKGGHYFTIWAARQTGKTWLLQQVMQEVPKRYGERFTVQRLTFGGLRGVSCAPSPNQEDVPHPIRDILEEQLPTNPIVPTWKAFRDVFARGTIFDRPVLLLCDEVDSIPSLVLDVLVAQLRELYIYYRQSHWLHGVALVGVRAVVGIESPRGSPFNVQRSLHVPNLTADEVRELYDQYKTESGQAIDPVVVEKVYDVTRGQPGLVSWFGELLTETYNPTSPYDGVLYAENDSISRKGAKTQRPDKESDSLENSAPDESGHMPTSTTPAPRQPIGWKTWRMVWHKARFAEPNNTLTNLIAKARMEEYQGFLVRVFNQPDVPFSFYTPIHNYLYMHGIIVPETIELPNGELFETCRFSSPFVQDCLYLALSRELVASPTTVLAVQPTDSLDDVFTDGGLNLPALLARYTDYLARLKAKGINPWQAQPRRETDYQLTEAVGHFHLYAWLQQAIGKPCAVSPEFPTGNGKVDIHIRCNEQQGLIEVKSFVDRYQLGLDKPKAATYAKQVGLDEVTMAVFIPVLDEEVLAQLSGTETHDGVQVHVVMIGWF